MCAVVKGKCAPSSLLLPSAGLCLQRTEEPLRMLDPCEVALTLAQHTKPSRCAFCNLNNMHERHVSGKPWLQHGFHLMLGGKKTLHWFSRRHPQSNNVHKLLVIPKSVHAGNWHAMVVLQCWSILDCNSPPSVASLVLVLRLTALVIMLSGEVSSFSGAKDFET